jgi:hypothetical protein
MAGTPIGLDRISHDDGRGAVSGVEDTADGVVQRGLGVETTTCRIGEPVDEAVEETAEAVDRVPLPRRVEVDAQPTSLEYVRVMKEPKMIDLHTRGCQVGSTDGDGELLMMLVQHHSPAGARYFRSPEPQAKAHITGPIEPMAAHHLDVSRIRRSYGI